MRPATDELSESAGEWARRTAVEQGLPPMIEDEDALQQIATLLFAGRPEFDLMNRRARNHARREPREST
jgi:broad specificity phosphatase PhoE